MVPRVLTIAGSDSGGGAGIQADLKAFAAAGAHGMSAIVALTAQSTVGVTAVHELPPEFVVAQLDAVFSDLGVDAAKTGMLFSRRVIDAVADFLGEHPVPLVVDPVMITSSGAKLLQDDAVDALVTRLFPLARVVTPNLAEARVLCVESPQTWSKRALAEAIVKLGAPAVSAPDHKLRRHEGDRKRAARPGRVAGEGACPRGGGGEGAARGRARHQHRHSVPAVDRGDAARRASRERGGCAGRARPGG